MASLEFVLSALAEVLSYPFRFRISQEQKNAGNPVHPLVFERDWEGSISPGKPPGSSQIPRLGGDFYWRQFSTAAKLKVDMAFVAMFDEVDEGTAIFKVTNEPPREGHFVTYEGLPADWYLRLTGEGSKLIRQQRKPSEVIPIKP